MRPCRAPGGWKITAENYKEVFIRLHMYENTIGAMRTDGNGSVFFTLDEVKKHIGLSVNISPESSTKFGSKLAKMIRRDAEQELKKQEAKLEAQQLPESIATDGSIATA